MVQLRSERLLIQPLATADADAFVAYRRRAEVARYQSWSQDYSQADALALIARQPLPFPGPGDWLQLGMHAGESLVGDLALHTLQGQPDSYELGVTVAVPGQGYATEGMLALMHHLFETRGAHRLVGRCDARNLRVEALLRRVGMRHEGRAVEADWCKGEWTTLDSWAILRSEWF